MKSILSILALAFLSFNLFSQTTLGVVIDAKEVAGLRQVEQPNGTQEYCLFNPDAMSALAIGKAINEMESEITFLEGQTNAMKTCGECSEELEASIKRNQGILKELTDRKK